MISISIGGIGQFLIATSSWIAIMRVVALYGSAPIAAYTIALRLIEFVFLPAGDWEMPPQPWLARTLGPASRKELKNLLNRRPDTTLYL